MIGYGLRSKDEYHIPRFDLSSTQKSTFDSGLQRFNRLPSDVRTPASLSVFESLLRK
ncbi:hypothetical protein HHI36_007788, partial [Cryptolaemus montrouzieri]